MEPLPDYRNLDLSGEALQAAARMEARAREPASQEMFEHLIFPLLTEEIKTVLEFGCGTGALARRIAHAAPSAMVYATDKSEAMLQVAQKLIDRESIPNIRLHGWDVLDETAFPFPNRTFDLIISSVVIPYLDDDQTHLAIKGLSSHLSPGGILAFMEQDLATDTVYFPKPEFLRGVLTHDLRNYKLTLGLGLRPALREVGLQVLPRRSFLWTDDIYGMYTRDLLERFADAACNQGQIKPEERDEWKQTLDDLAKAGDFYYGIVYHLVAGKYE